MTFEQEHMLEEGEVILEKVRKHWIVYVNDFLIHFFGCAIFSIAAMYLSSKGSLVFISTSTGSYGAMILIMFVLIFWTSFFFTWTKNFFDVWYVTNQHIIAINQKQILEREDAHMELNRIQDISFEKNGFLQTMLGYGALKVQSAGAEVEFTIEDVRDVEGSAHRIMELRDEAQKQVTGDSL
ncbi:MAG: PH domain-containing protein [Candidatus Paceibacterota bacterium]